MPRGHPIDVTIRVVRLRHPTVKCYASKPMIALHLALGKCCRERLLPPATEVLGVEFSGLQPGEPIDGEDIIRTVKYYGFVWRGK